MVTMNGKGTSAAIGAFYLFVGCLSMFALHVQPAACLPLPPEKTITIVTQDVEQPSWKLSWDKARELVKQEAYEEAISYYTAVLAEKPHIEEVRWELCRVLISVEDYEQAAWYLEGLLELDPTRKDYLISAGKLALIKGNNDRALELFGQVLEQDPLSGQADQALVGMVQALKNMDRVQLAIPLMEQLYQRGASGPDLLLDLARATAQNGTYDKACHYFVELIKKYRVSAAVLTEAADLLEQQSRIDEAARLWQRLLEERPDDLLYRKKLADYYTSRNRLQQALPHLLYLAEQGIKREEYLLTIAHIYLYEEGRVDRALAYFQRYQTEFPEGEDVSARIAEIQLILANDLLTIVENNGAWMLWRDLATVTPDRIGIYRAMASLLEKLGKHKELVEVLQIIVLHAPEDTASLEALARLYVEDNSFESCISLLRSNQDSPAFPAALHLLLARCQQEVGRDIDQLQSYVSYLQDQPDDLDIRIQAIHLAGEVGLLDTVEALFTTASPDAKHDGNLFRTYLDALLTNHLYATAEHAIDAFFAHNQHKSTSSALLLQKKAEGLFRRGNWSEAEEVLRQLLADYPESVDALLSLAGFALDRQEYAAANTWVTAAKQLVDSGVGIKADSPQKQVLFNRQVKLHWYTGNRQQVTNQILEHFADPRLTTPLSEADYDTILFLLHTFTQDQQEAEKSSRLHMLLGHLKPNAQTSILQQLVSSQRPADAPPQSIERIARSVSLPIADRLDLCEALIRLDRPGDALACVETIRENIPESLRARVLGAQALYASREYKRAHEEYSTLAETLPGEESFRAQKEQLTLLLGHPGSSPIETGQSDGWQQGFDNPRAVVNQARTFWAEDRWDEALNLYESLHLTLKKQVMGALDHIKDTDTFIRRFPEAARKSVLISMDDADMLDEIMSPSFFVANRAEVISRLSASVYNDYRWWKIVDKELEAKRALNAREFYQAERTYQELQDIDVTAVESSYADLATIYSRLGKRQKEAELYEKLKDTKQDVPVLKEAAERNVRQRQPHLSLDTTYREERGRDDYIDITQAYSGMNVQFTPAVFHEAGAWFGRNEYGNSDATTLAKSVFLSSSYAIQFNDYLEGKINLGFEDFDTDGKSFLIFDVALEGNLEEKVNVFVSLNQHPVADTIVSLTEGIYKKQFNAGIVIDYLPRVFLGFDFSMHDFSDMNDGRAFNLFAAYRFFKEQSSLDLSYRYQKIENSIDNQYADDETGLDLTALPYWSPGKYWRHLATAEYRIELWPTGKLQGGTSYVSALYGVGLEKGDSLLQKLEFNISLEISPVFLVKGAFSSDWSSDYDHYGVSASLAYRW
jgi:tetratricopeptide (TPR) repeat protein